MSEFNVSLRLTGELGPLEEVAAALAHVPLELRRQGEIYRRGRVQPRNVLMLRMADWARGGDFEDDPETGLVIDDEKLAQTAETIRAITPALASVDRSRCKAELWISTIRYEEQGGFELPSSLIATAAAAELSIAISIMVGLEDDEPEVEREPTDGRGDGNRGGETTSG